MVSQPRGEQASLHANRAQAHASSHHRRMGWKPVSFFFVLRLALQSQRRRMPSPAHDTKLRKLSEKMLVYLMLAGSMDHNIVDHSFNPEPAEETLRDRPTVASLALSSTASLSCSLYLSLSKPYWWGGHGSAQLQGAEAGRYCKHKVSLGTTEYSRPARANRETLSHKQTPNQPNSPLTFYFYCINGMPNSGCLMNRMATTGFITFFFSSVKEGV